MTPLGDGSVEREIRSSGISANVTQPADFGIGLKEGTNRTEFLPQCASTKEARYHDERQLQAHDNRRRHSSRQR